MSGQRTKAATLLLVSLVAFDACIGSDSAAPPIKAPEAKAEEKFERPPRARPAGLKSTLTSKHIRSCLYEDQLDPSEIAGLYYNVTDLVAGQVEVSRSLPFETPSSEMLGPEAFAREVRTAHIKPRSAEVITTRSLAWALGLTPSGLDVNEFLKGEGTGLLAGFYDPKTEQIVVERKGKLDAEYVVLAHEFIHAATDQAFGLPDNKFKNIIDDERLATSSLIEGDAALGEMRILSRFAPQHSVKKAVKAQVAFPEKFKADRGAGVPYLLMDTVLFPYQWGPAFVCSIYKERGWSGVNRMYSQPPTTTAQILFPERYLRREAARAPAPLSRPPRPWKLKAKGDIGAAHLKALFEAPGDVESRALSRPFSRAAAWAGGTYEVWSTITTNPGSKSRRRKSETGDTTSSIHDTEASKREQETGTEGEEIEQPYVVGVSLIEHKEHRGSLCSSMNSWYRAAFGSADHELIADRTVQYSDYKQDAVIACPKNKVILGFGPSPELARAIAGMRSDASTSASPGAPSPASS
ncbi:MAG: hypothetical protein M3280_03885 [Actinomycetota bacterium]|nr:hypothetical protein [Actinomycetota bacterium]